MVVGCRAILGGTTSRRAQKRCPPHNPDPLPQRQTRATTTRTAVGGRWFLHSIHAYDRVSVLSQHHPVTNRRLRHMGCRPAATACGAL